MPVGETIGHVLEKYGGLVTGVILGGLAGFYIATQTMQSTVDAHKQSADYAEKLRTAAERSRDDKQKIIDDKQKTIEQLSAQIANMAPRAELEAARTELHHYTEALSTLDVPRSRTFQEAQSWCPWDPGHGPCFEVKDVSFNTIAQPKLTIASNVWSSPIMLSSQSERPIKREEFVWSGKQYDLILDTDSDWHNMFSLRIDAHSSR